MAEYIYNGVDLVHVDDRINFKDPNSIKKDCCIEIGQNGFIFNKSGLYMVSVSGNCTTVTNVTDQKEPCDGCVHDPRRKPKIERSVIYIPEPCVCCSRRCVDHYERGE